MNYRKLIKTLEEQLGLSHSEMGKAIGVSQRAIYAYLAKDGEHSREPPRAVLMNLQRLAESNNISQKS